MNKTSEKWDAIYRQSQSQAVAAKVLSEHRYLLPKQGQALDLACGVGGNALLMAEAGLNVDALDISLIALQRVEEQAVFLGRHINVKQCDISAEILPEAFYDVIVISRFLDRALCNAIMASLNAGGILFYQTFTRSKIDQSGPGNPDYLLAANELLRLFAPLTLLFYQEDARIGDLQYGNRNEAYFIGQKPLLPEQL